MRKLAYLLLDLKVEQLEKVGGTWINANPTSTSVIGIATDHVGLTSELKDPGTRIALGDINLTDGTITFT